MSDRKRIQEDKAGKAEFPKLKIGKYTICRPDGGNKIWIQSDDGDGGTFSIETFEAVLDAYFQEYF